MYTAQTFNIPELKGISKRTVEEHLKLYAGYVKSANLILDKIGELSADTEKNAYLIGELQRRFGFEYNGMRNHEHYFKSFEGGPAPLAENSELRKTLVAQCGNFENWLKAFTALALTRGIGWAMLYYDPATKMPIGAWVDEQHLGQLNGLPLIIGLDMWEHSFIIDYSPADKRKYIAAFFENLNWNTIEKKYLAALKK